MAKVLSHNPHLLEQRLASIFRAYYQQFAAFPTVTPFETILPVNVGSIRTRVSVGENESLSEKFCQPFTLSSGWLVGKPHLTSRCLNPDHVLIKPRPHAFGADEILHTLW